MTGTARWKKAQEYEEAFWRSIAEEVAQNSLKRIGFYEWRAGEFRKLLEKTGQSGLLDGSRKIMEIGSGPVGIIGYLPGQDRSAIDPLNRFYSTDPNLTLLRSPGVQYVDAPGEAIPVESSSYDLVIMENCIDHTADPTAVLREIHRVLVPGGTLYLTVNARSRPGYWMHRLLARLELDPGHPHTFTERRFSSFLEAGGFDLSYFESTSWWQAWKRDLTSGGWKPRAKGLLFVSEHLLTAIAKRRD